MPENARRDDTEKQDRLREAGTLNRTPEKVSDPAFASGDFFDSRDLLQVRYIAQTAARFGVSRDMEREYRGWAYRALTRW